MQGKGNQWIPGFRWGLALLLLASPCGGEPERLGDIDADGKATIFDVVILNNHIDGTATLPAGLEIFADLNQDVAVDNADVDLVVDAILGLKPLPDLPLTALIESSPQNGEGDVAVTRETILRFNGPLSDTITVDQSSLFAEFAGNLLDARIHVAKDRRSVTLFYNTPLPSSARVRVTLVGDQLRNAQGFLLDADGDGFPGGTQTIDFETLSLTVLDGTAVCGRVFAAKEVQSEMGMMVNVPLEGVRIEVEGMPESFAVTDSNGNFRLDPAPVGRFFVFIDGRPAVNAVPAGAYYAFIGKPFESIAGEEVNLPDIFLPLIADGTLQAVSETQDTQITAPAAVITENPALANVSLTVPAGSLFSDDGTSGGQVGIAPVPPDRLPGPLPAGLNFPLVITVQTDGPTNFDSPVPVCFPNLPDPDTGVTLGIGEKTALWSFNHDIGEFEIVGPATVVDDGSGGTLVCSDPGVGILAPGWHGVNRGIFAFLGRLFSGGGPTTPQEPTDCQPANPTDPVFLFSGEVYEEVVDLQIKGRGFDFVWKRKYRSKIGPNTAQGNGWDCSYNILLEKDGEELVLFNGNTRQDRYRLQPNGNYAAEGFFRELSENPDGTLSLTFEDTSRWDFNPLDGSPTAGKIIRRTDRNNNAMAFAYDAQGRLATITDTLGRDITITYNSDNFISSVTDFLGRSVVYEYYNGIETGGNFGDLKSVTSPSVTGTPNANDFPNGKKTTYTYSTGFANDRLNSNLLTITDGRRNDPNDPTFGEGPYVSNSYSNITDPSDPMFDRAVRQVWGGAELDFTYNPLLPSNANGGAVMKTILNDRVGNVTEFFFDNRNHMVRRRSFTGRANPAEPTTNRNNRPAGKLRADDPDFFETVFEWTEDSLQRRIIEPNGAVTEFVYEIDLDPDAGPRSRGNIRKVVRLPGDHQPVGDQDRIEESFDYDTNFQSGCCGFNFVTRKVDGNGNETLFDYDARGNLTRITHPITSSIENFEYNEFGQRTARILPPNDQGLRRRDEFAYYPDGTQKGYLETVLTDAANEALSVTYEYDPAGNLTRMIDPRGNDTLFSVNSLDQVVRETSREFSASSGIRIERDIYYDANNNVIRDDIQNRDENGQLQTNGTFTSTLEYDILNKLVRVTDEVDESHSVVTEFEYDANRNRVLKRFGEAANGNQPTNLIRTLFDERDLPFKVIRGEGDTFQSTVQFDYDGNANNTRVALGIEGLLPCITTSLYDAFNRTVEINDPMGNVARFGYDANGNTVSRVKEGELLDGPGSAGNVRLSEETFLYDGMNRLLREDRAFFDPSTQAPIGDGLSTMQFSYADDSQVVRIVDDNNNEKTLTYDTLNRLKTETDAKGNTKTFTYDGNNNVTTVVQVEKSDLGGADETFTTRFEYDPLDRLLAEIDNENNRTDLFYDSRGNVALRWDALRASPTGPGNRTRFVYDGLNRLTEVVKTLTSDGTGAGSETGSITLQQSWDDSSRLVSQRDAGGNISQYDYDALNRRTVTRFPDGTETVAVFDVRDNLVSVTDANGSVSAYTYDALNRRLRRDITPGANVSSDFLFEAFQYDGLSRMAAAQNDDSSLTFTYDSLSRQTSETLNGETTSSAYDGMGNRLSAVYPGGRSIGMAYDALNRRKTITDTTTSPVMIANYDYIGPRRVARRDLGNTTRSNFSYDGLRRINRLTHIKDPDAGAATFDDRSFAWDAVNHKVSYNDLLTGGTSRSFAYDSVGRLVSSTATPDGGSPAAVSFNLDGAGNRTTLAGGADPGSYTLDATAPQPSDSQLNQYSTTPFDAREYDEKGNLVAIDKNQASERTFGYDARNLLVSQSIPSSGSVSFTYDALGRRIEKVVDNGSPQVTRYFYRNWQVVEEQDGAGNTTATYVYGRNFDDILSMQRGDQNFFYHADDLGNIVKITDSTGAVAEAYAYDDFGQPAISDPSGNPLAASALDNPYLFNARRFDPETGFYYYRTRYLDPRAGRFNSRDMAGLFGDPVNLGNGNAFVGNNPWSFNDSFGLSATNPVVNADNAVAAASITGFLVAPGATRGGRLARVLTSEGPNLLTRASNSLLRSVETNAAAIRAAQQSGVRGISHTSSLLRNQRLLGAADDLARVNASKVTQNLGNAAFAIGAAFALRKAQEETRRKRCEAERTRNSNLSILDIQMKAILDLLREKKISADRAQELLEQTRSNFEESEAGLRQSERANILLEAARGFSNAISNALPLPPGAMDWIPGMASD